MTRMQVARVFAKRRSILDAQSRNLFDEWIRATSDKDRERYRTEFRARVGECAVITALWHDLNAAWDNEAPAHTARKGKE